MDSIRGAQGVASLRKASERVVVPVAAPEEEAAADASDLTGALKMALMMRKDAMFGEGTLFLICCVKQPIDRKYIGSEDSDDDHAVEEEDDWE